MTREMEASRTVIRMNRPPFLSTRRNLSVLPRRTERKRPTRPFIGRSIPYAAPFGNGCGRRSRESTINLSVWRYQGRATAAVACWGSG